MKCPKCNGYRTRIIGKSQSFPDKDVWVCLDCSTEEKPLDSYCFCIHEENKEK